MKLSKSKLTETLRRLNDGKTVYQARKVAENLLNELSGMDLHVENLDIYRRELSENTFRNSFATI